MRPPVKVPPPHVVKSAETSPVGTYDSAAGAEQIEISYASDHQVNVAPLHVLGAGRVPSTSCVSAAGTEQAETSMDIDLLVTGSLWFPHDSLWSYVHMDDGDITNSLKFSRTTVAEDVLGSHCVSKEKPRLALLTAPAARRSTRTSLDEACGKSAPCTSGLIVVQCNTGESGATKQRLPKTLRVQEESSSLNEPITSQQFQVVSHPEANRRTAILRNRDTFFHTSKHHTFPWREQGCAMMPVVSICLFRRSRATRNAVSLR